MRSKLKKIHDYKPEFDEVFKDFLDGNLPRDDLFYKIKDEIENKEDLEKQAKNLLKEPVLPKMY